MLTPNDIAKQGESLYLKTFGDLYECSAWVVKGVFNQVVADQQYNNIQRFHALLSSYMLKADDNLKLNLIRAHPTLAGKQAQNNELTEFSTAEQDSAGLSQCTVNEIQEFECLNKEYFDKFSFPFIMAVRGLSKTEIKSAFKQRLQNDYKQEFKVALNEINQISLLRLKAIYT